MRRRRRKRRIIAEYIYDGKDLGYPCIQSTTMLCDSSCFLFQISFASASSELSDRARFQYYFRTTPSFVNYVTAILGILNKYKWKQLAFITQNSGTFLKV